MKLNEIRDNFGARRKKTTLGRGVGSGLGKTCGRGGKGQTARSGVRLKGFQGGQTPLSRRLPKRGFVNIHAQKYSIVNLFQIEYLISTGKLDVKTVIDGQALHEAGCFRRVRDGVRVLGDGTLSHAVRLEVVGISATARQAVEKAGGHVTLLGE